MVQRASAIKGVDPKLFVCACVQKKLLPASNDYNLKPLDIQVYKQTPTPTMVQGR